MAPWIFDIGADYDMCPSNAPGIRTESKNLSAIIAAKGHAFPDLTITTCIGAIWEKAGCVPIEGLSVSFCRSAVDAANPIAASAGSRSRKCQITYRPKEFRSRSSGTAIHIFPLPDPQSATQQTMTTT